MHEGMFIRESKTYLLRKTAKSHINDVGVKSISPDLLLLASYKFF